MKTSVAIKTNVMQAALLSFSEKTDIQVDTAAKSTDVPLTDGNKIY